MVTDRESILFRNRFYYAIKRGCTKTVEAIITEMGKIISAYDAHFKELEIGQLRYYIVFIQFLEEVKECTTETFSEEENRAFQQLLPKEKVWTCDDITNGLITINCAKNLAKKYEPALLYLKELLKCISNYGLHLAIENRNPALHTRYNLMIDYKSESGQSETEYVQLIGHQLLIDIIKNYQEGKPSVNGVLIKKGKTVRITITSTLLTDEEIVLFKQKNNIQNDLDFIQQCNHQTNALLFRPTMQPIYPVVVAARSPLIASYRDQSLQEKQELIQAIIKSIHALQKKGYRLAHAKIGPKTSSLHENGIRDLFQISLASRYPAINAESEQKGGRVDLRIHMPVTGQEFILEFKKYENRSRKRVAQQTLNYLTDFEQAGFIIVLIPSTAKDITSHYQHLIEQQSASYIRNSWTPIADITTNFVYYRSEHRADHKIKILYHFICRL